METPNHHPLKVQTMTLIATNRAMSEVVAKALLGPTKYLVIVNRTIVGQPHRSMPYRQMKDRLPSDFRRNQFCRRSSSVSRLNIAGDCPPIHRGRSST